MHQLLLDVWREACRHIEIEESAERIARLLADDLPADLLLVRRLDLERSRLETVGAGRGRPGPLPALARTETSTGPMQALLAWCRRGRVTRGVPGGGDPVLALVVPPEVTGEVLAGPLADADQPLGVVVVVARDGGAFTAAHEALVQSLLEPFAVALANDARLHELARLREALEADKSALLTRLDRQDVADSLVGSEAGLKGVLDRVGQVAPTDAPVLLLGETGTGKEVVARAIHAQSRRAGGPVVRVNCGAFPSGLVDSELFGHERGSFTGATGSRKGFFERADGGTLFLDEIGELPLEVQVRLLRILQDGTFERVGGTKTLSVDVRIVAATHRELREMVARGTFREDLWYRISVFPIYIPPLRDRLEDIPALAAHFAWRAGRRLGGHPLTPNTDDIDLLLAYPWPGNVRELASVIERAAILGDGRRLDVPGALGVATRGPGSPAGGAPPAGVPGARSRGDAALHELTGELLTLDAAMAHHITRALERTGGRIEGARGAAALLGINPHTLRARMRKLGVEWASYRGTAS